ncbi:ADP-ribosylglycohydrolase family protein [Clostridiaceae bacterium 35-E11]
MEKKSRFEGCLVGGAVGDALGWPVEFLKLDEIKKRFGDKGVIELVHSDCGKAEITDDTQMTMFTAEGILRAESRLRNKGICHAPTVIYFAYQRWLATQGYPKKESLDWIYDGWLMNRNELHARRAPGNSCITALVSDDKGTLENPINNSKGCGAVMRSAPFGLFLEKNSAYEIAKESAALTHGHPTGYVTAGALANIIAEIVGGTGLRESIFNTIEKLSSENSGMECTKKLRQALDLSGTDIPDYKAISEIGEGWIAEEALGISVFCALRYETDFRKALIASVNHNGDSDSTGSITGNILGALLGIQNIPQEWLESVELFEEIIELANDLLLGYQDGDSWWKKYPGY